MRDTTATASTDIALDELLAGLGRRLGLDAWMIVRREGEAGLSLAATHGDDVPLEAGQRMAWSDTVCARMVAGEGPRAAPDLAEVPAYAEAPVARRLGLGAYIGVPIESDRGVEGTICGIDRAPQRPDIADELGVLELCAGLVARLWAAERDARTDALTGLPNRRGWEEALEREEHRCARFGHDAGVIAVDLNDFKQVNDRLGHAVGDQVLHRTGRAIVAAVRDSDLVARWAGDEFCVLAVECDGAAIRALCERVTQRLAEAGVSASVAYGLRGTAGLERAANEAFGAMEHHKRIRVPQTMN